MGKRSSWTGVPRLTSQWLLALSLTAVAEVQVVGRVSSGEVLVVGAELLVDVEGGS